MGSKSEETQVVWIFRIGISEMFSKVRSVKICLDLFTKQDPGPRLPIANSTCRSAANMAVAKRKNTPESGQISGSPPKRFKKEQSLDSKPKKSRFTEEAETDSDPIVESDTGSESGEDDGASWPSDGEGDEVWGMDKEADIDARTMDIATDASDVVHPAREDIHKSGTIFHQD